MLKLLIPLFILSYSCKESNLTNNKSETISKNTTNKIVQKEKNCGYNNEVSNLGIGLIIAPEEFEVYNDSLLINKYGKWNMYEDDINLCPKFFKPDYGIIQFVCIKETEKSYQILINFSDVKFLPKSKKYNFITWESYITQSFGVKRNMSNIKNSLKINPNKNSNNIEIPKGQELFCPIEIKGDWLRVTYDCFYNNQDNKYEGEHCKNYIENCQNPITGWLKWKKENNLLIDIFLMP